MMIIFNLTIAEDSPLKNKKTKDIEREYNIKIYGFKKFIAGKDFSIEGKRENLKDFVKKYMPEKVFLELKEILGN